MVNKYQKHLLILAEDNIYKEFVTGFAGHAAVNRNKIQIDESAEGWPKLLKIFSEEYVNTMIDYTERYVLLLLDLDKSKTRYDIICSKIPIGIQDRVFILSCQDEAERLKKDLGGGKNEPIGRRLADSCYHNTYAAAASDNPWLCPQLQHNGLELTRLATAVRPFLFSLDAY